MVNKGRQSDFLAGPDTVGDKLKSSPSNNWSKHSSSQLSS